MPSWIGNTNFDRSRCPGGATDGVSLLPVCSPTRALLAVRDLSVSYGTGDKRRVVIEALDFEIRTGEMLGMTGRSGCGKTSAALALLRLLPPSARVTGAAFFGGKNLLGLKESEICKIRGRQVSIMYQEPALALNPVMRVGDQIAEVLRAHTTLARRECREHARQMLNQIQLGSERYYGAYPHELSGGECHRIVLAQALACRPLLVIADEPTAGLDAKLKTEVLDLIDRLRRETGAAFWLISHDGSVTARADRTIDLSPSSSRKSSSHCVSMPCQPSQQMPLVSVRNLRKSYRPRGLFRSKHAEKHALHSIDFSIAKGSLTALVGPSGSGKSTLARCISLLEEADQGEILFEGKNLQGLRGPELRTFRAGLQYVFQDPAAALNPRLSAAEAISEPLVIQNRGTREDRRKRVEILMRETGLDPATADRSCHEFSGGQKQRLAIARALALEPHLLIFDESFSGLDRATRDEILDVLRNLRHKLGITQLLISHDLEIVSKVADSVVEMRDGRIVGHHEPKKIDSNANDLPAEHMNPPTQRDLVLSGAE